jgi:hypothetical protein
MTLRSKVVKFIGLDFLDDPYEIRSVGQIPIMHAESHLLFMRILVKMIDPRCIERRRSAFDSMDFIPFAEQILGQVRPILTGNAGDQRLFQWMPPFGFKVIEKVIDPETQG